MRAHRMRRLGDVVPLPVSVRPDPAASFRVVPGTAVSTVPAAADIAEQVAGLLRRVTGLPVPIEDGGSIRILLEGYDKNPAGRHRAGTLDHTMARDHAEGHAQPAGWDRAEGDDRLAGRDGTEAYRLEVAAGSVTLSASTTRGLFAGLQTLRQLLPAEREPAEREPGEIVLPGGTIEDAPRFPYRGAMLDLARHFFRPAEIRSYVDAIVQLKINHLHLHLTDDQGWRIEVPGWPRLTEVGGGAGTGIDGAGGGFLTVDEYAELVAYADTRFVTIVPEIDLPGHVNAAQVAYPELTRDGRPVGPRTDAEVGYSSLAADQEITYRFVEDVIRSVASLTTGPYLHIGGDEAFSTPPADYRAFLNRVLPMVAAHGKRVIGWHEMVAAELPAGAIPQYWRTEPAHDGVARAVAAGHQVIMSPADRVYLDMKYDEGTALGLDWAGPIGVRRSYDWDPADRLPGVGEGALLGVEAPLWSETLRSLADVEFLAFPRLAAVAEVGWTPRGARDWPSFRRRLAGLGPIWTAHGINFHRSTEIEWEL